MMTSLLPAEQRLTIRPRQDRDVAALVELLGRQQPVTHYPLIWPLNFPVEDFIRRPSELSAWTATIGERIVGHVAVQRSDEDEFGEVWSRSLGVPIDELRVVGTLFADVELAGSGIGSALIAEATRVAAEDGYPVLDVVAAHSGPTEFYRWRGWREVGTAMAPWHPGIPIEVRLMVRDRAMPVR